MGKISKTKPPGKAPPVNAGELIKASDGPVYMADTAGRVMRITREQDLGGGAFWFVAETVPPYGGQGEVL